jgi:hypothetical protein
LHEVSVVDAGVGGEYSVDVSELTRGRRRRRGTAIPGITCPAATDQKES